MSNEENKNQEQKEKENPQEVKQPETEKAPEPGIIKPSERQIEPKTKKEPEKKEKPKECIICNKSIKDKWYYRESNYYCGKGCWKKSKKKPEEEKK